METILFTSCNGSELLLGRIKAGLTELLFVSLQRKVMSYSGDAWMHLQLQGSYPY